MTGTSVEYRGKQLSSVKVMNERLITNNSTGACKGLNTMHGRFESAVTCYAKVFSFYEVS